VRLLLDEQLSSTVATQLKRRTHDVVTVTEAGLRGRDDAAVLAWATAERRTVVTNNIRDFRPLHAARLTSGSPHFGLILVSSVAYSLKRRRLGPLIQALEALLAANPGEDALRDREVFL